MKSLTFRRGEHVSVDGGPGVVTFLDETGTIVFVDMRSLIEQIGIPLREETDRISNNEALIDALHLCKDFTYLNGIKQTSLFIPLDFINDYLYSVPMPGLRPEVAGNLDLYRQRFAIEADRHWHRLEKSEAATNPLDWSRLLINQRRYQISQAVKPLDSEPGAIFELCILSVADRPVPIDSLDSRQLDLLNLALSLALDVLVFCVENGYDFEAACGFVKEGLDRHIISWNF